MEFGLVCRCHMGEFKTWTQHPGSSGGGTLADRARLEQAHMQAAAKRLLGNCQADNPAANDEQIRMHSEAV